MLLQAVQDILNLTDSGRVCVFDSRHTQSVHSRTMSAPQLCEVISSLVWAFAASELWSTEHQQ